METDTWKIENNICRCCHAEGYFFNLAEPRPFCGKTEVYSDMIRDIFDIDMKPVPGPACELTYTICMSCIFKLREAIQFKKQVQSCEDKFLDYYYTNKLEVTKKKEVSKSVIKLEPVIEFKEEYLNEDELDSNDDTNLDFEMNDADDDDDDNDNDGSKSDDDVEFLPTKGKGKGKGKSEAVLPKVEAEAVKAEQRTTNKKLVKVERIKVPVKKKGDPADDKRYAITWNEDGTKDFTCRICQRVYKKQNSATQHYKEVHLKLRRRLRSCYLCDVSVPGWLRPEHMEQAHGIPRPSCNACGKKFNYNFKLLNHQRTYHMGELDYECEFCQKRFPKNDNLKKHLLVHQKEKPFQCTLCDKWFKAKKYLRIHMKIHLNDRRYACTVCGERFVQTSSLKYHMGKRHPEMI